MNKCLHSARTSSGESHHYFSPLKYDAEPEVSPELGEGCPVVLLKLQASHLFPRLVQLEP